MNYTQNIPQDSTMQGQAQFMLPAVTIDDEFSADELAEDMDGLQMSFPRVKIPSGGSLQFEVPSDDPENPDYTQNLTGIILFNHDSNAYWPEDDEADDSNAPACSSMDGKSGHGSPGGYCTACVLNAFGSGTEGRGKACKNMRTLYLLRDGDLMPLQINLPPTSIRPFKQFLSQAFTNRRRATYGSLVEIGLKKMSNGKDNYSVATFRLLSDFAGEELANIRAYTNGFKEQIRMLQQNANANEQQYNSEYYNTSAETTSANVTPISSNEQCYAHPIDGDYIPLPA